MIQFLLLVPAVIFFLLGCMVIRHTVPDMQFGGIITGLLLFSLGAMLGSLVLHPLIFLACSIAAYGVYWLLEQRGLFDLLFLKR